MAARRGSRLKRGGRPRTRSRRPQRADPQVGRLFTSRARSQLRDAGRGLRSSPLNGTAESGGRFVPGRVDFMARSLHPRVEAVHPGSGSGRSANSTLAPKTTRPLRGKLQGRPARGARWTASATNAAPARQLPRSTHAEPVISVRGLVKRYGNHQAVAASTSTCGEGRSSPSSARTARARPPRSRSWKGSGSARPARSASSGGPGRRRAAPGATGSASSCRSQSPSPACPCASAWSCTPATTASRGTSTRPSRWSA